MYIATSTNERYFYGMLVMLHSLFQNNMKENFTVYCLYYDLSGEFLNKAKLLSQKYKNDFISIKIDKDKYANFPTDFYPIETCFRLELPYILKDIKKILYLDADLLIRNEIKELYDLDLGDNYLAAGNQITIGGNILKQYKTLCDNKNIDYFNAGVLLMNLQKLRNDVAFSEYDNFFINYGNKAILPDEFLLNMMFGNRVIRFNSKQFNYAFSKQTPYSDSATILHFVNIKPWLGQYDDVYNEYLKEWWTYADTLPGIGLSAAFHQSKISSHQKKIINLLIKWATIISDLEIIKFYVNQMGWKKVAIYGCGQIGKMFGDYISKNMGVTISCFIDKVSGDNYNGIPIVNLREVKNQVDATILTTIKYDREISFKIQQQEITSPVVPFETLVDELYEIYRKTHYE